MELLVSLSCLPLDSWSLKCQKWFIFVFFWWQHKISHNLGKLFKCIWKILFNSFRKCYGLLSSKILLARCQPLKTQDFGIFLWTQQFFWYFYSQYLTNSNFKAKIFPVYLNVLLSLWLVFSCHQQKVQKMNHFDILMNINLGVSMMIRQMTPYFSSTRWALSIGIFISTFQKLQNSIPWGSFA